MIHFDVMIENPKELFITRKRKKWKFAHFDQWEHCFQADQVSSKMWADYFGNNRPLVVEIGAGTADLSVGLAHKYPDQQHVAIDIKSDRLYTGAKYAFERQLTNIAFVRAHMNEIGAIFTPNSVKELWITFPDPFERKKHAKRRLTHQDFLEKYKMLLTKDGIIKFKTDNHHLFLWSLEQIAQAGWRIRELCFDLHTSDLPGDYKTTTVYERRFQAEGVPIHFVSFYRTER